VADCDRNPVCCCRAVHLAGCDVTHTGDCARGGSICS
jgi:hypothetical protein